MKPLDQVYMRGENFVFRRIEDETVLVPIKNRVGDVDSLFSLNPVGAFIWQQIDGRNSLGTIRDLVLDEFDVGAETAEADLLKFISDLDQIGAVQSVEEKGT